MEYHGAASLLVCVWRSKLYILLAACFSFSLGLSILLPALPQLATNFFASQHAGYKLYCEDYALDDQPWACQEAHSDVVRWASLNSLVANTFLAFFFAPLVGDLSDRLGRKPFILGGITLAVLPVGAVWLHLTHDVSFLWYYPFNALTVMMAPLISFLSYTADVLRPELRTSGFGLISAAFSIGFMFGPGIGAVMGPTQAALCAAGAMGGAFLIVLVAVPESRPPKTNAPPRGPPRIASAPSGTAAAAAVLTPSPAAVATAATRRRHPLEVFRSMRRSWELINSSSMFRRLALCMAVVGIVSEGIQDMLLQYLQLVMGFNTQDQTVLITVLGGGNFMVQALLLPHLNKLMGERNLLVFGLLFSMTEQMLLALSAVKWQAITSVSLSALASVSFPAISSLKSTHASAEQQGLVQGALAGIRAVASGLGPLGLAQLFAMSTTTEAAFGYKPSIVFWTTCALTVVAAAVAASIPADAAKVNQDSGPAPAGQGHTHAAMPRRHGGGSDQADQGAWLLGDEEDGCCRVKTVSWEHSHKPGDSAATFVGAYKPPVAGTCTDAAPLGSPCLAVVVQSGYPAGPADVQQQGCDPGAQQPSIASPFESVAPAAEGLLGECTGAVPTSHCPDGGGGGQLPTVAQGLRQPLLQCTSRDD